jgi:hypothetical protein
MTTALPTIPRTCLVPLAELGLALGLAVFFAREPSYRAPEGFEGPAARPSGRDGGRGREGRDAEEGGAGPARDAVCGGAAVGPGLAVLGPAGCARPRRNRRCRLRRGGEGAGGRARSERKAWSSPHDPASLDPRARRNPQGLVAERPLGRPSRSRPRRRHPQRGDRQAASPGCRRPRRRLAAGRRRARAPAGLSARPHDISAVRATASSSRPAVGTRPFRARANRARGAAAGRRSALPWTPRLPLADRRAGGGRLWLLRPGRRRGRFLLRRPPGAGLPRRRPLSRW